MASIPNPSAVHLCDVLDARPPYPDAAAPEIILLEFGGEVGSVWELLLWRDPFSRILISFCPWCGVRLEARSRWKPKS